MNYSLGRIPSVLDERDFRTRDLMITLEAMNLRSITPKVWVDTVVLDQGDTPHCVGYGWTGWGISTPVVDSWSNSDGERIYVEAKIVDGEPGEQNGSSVRSGAIVMQKNEKRLSVYSFASSITEAAIWLDQYSPVVLGIDWTNDMFNPDTKGIIRPTGGVSGGHCILWKGITALNGLNYAVLQNSWGSSWGINGDCYISLTDLQSLFNDQGEACCAIELPLPAPVSPTPIPPAPPIPTPTPPKPSCWKRFFRKSNNVVTININGTPIASMNVSQNGNVTGKIKNLQ